jgi:hypothetical protein
MLQLIFALIVVAQTPEPSGVAQIRRDAKAMGLHVTTDLARDFLRAGSALPEIHDRTLYQDVAKKTYLSEKAVQKLEAASGPSIFDWRVVSLSFPVKELVVAID